MPLFFLCIGGLFLGVVKIVEIGERAPNPARDAVLAFVEHLKADETEAVRPIPVVQEAGAYKICGNPY